MQARTFQNETEREEYMTSLFKASKPLDSKKGKQVTSIAKEKAGQKSGEKFSENPFCFERSEGNSPKETPCFKNLQEVSLIGSERSKQISRESKENESKKQDDLLDLEELTFLPQIREESDEPDVESRLIKRMAEVFRTFKVIKE